MPDYKKMRAVIGALIPLLSFILVGSALFSQDWYGGRAEYGTESTIGWWNATVEYDLFNGTVWVGENDNFVGAPHYTRYVFNYTGSSQFMVLSSAICLLSSMVLILSSFVFGLLSGFRIVGGGMPLMLCVLALVLVVVPGLVMHQRIEEIANSDLEYLQPVIEEDIPSDEIHMLNTNVTHGSAFDLLLYSVPGLVISPLLFIGIRREKLPTSDKLASNFFKDDEEEIASKKRRSRVVKDTSKEEVKSGSLFDD